MKLVVGKLMLLVSLLIMIGCSGMEEQAKASGSYSSVVDYVKDGDTIMLKSPVRGTNEVRFLGIDTPETFVSGGKDPGNQVDPHGNASKQYLQRLLPSGTKITLVTGAEEKDGFGRLLAYVYLGDTEINRMILETGHAVTYFISPFENSKFESYRQAMLAAMNGEIGIWNPVDPLEELPFEYRDRMFNEQPDKYVGNYFTKEYVTPPNYEQIPIEDRAYFFTEQDAISAGYTCECSNGSVANLLIQEVYYDTVGTDREEEYVEIYNASGETANIGGYVLADNYSTFTLPSNTTVESGQYLIVARDAAGFHDLFGFDPDVSGMSLALGNSGDQVTLRDPNGNEIDFVAYENYVQGWDIHAETGDAIYRFDVKSDTDTVNDWNVGIPLPGK